MVIKKIPKLFSTSPPIVDRAQFQCRWLSCHHMKLLQVKTTEKTPSDVDDEMWLKACKKKSLLLRFFLSNF